MSSGPEAIRPVYLCVEKALARQSRPNISQMLVKLLRGMQISPLSDCIRASVRLFDRDVIVVQHMSTTASWELSADLIRRPDVPPSVASAHAFGPLFGHLRQEIGHDVRQLEEDGYRVRRPCVCIISNGIAEDDWTADHEELIDDDERPDIVALPGCAVRKGAPLDLPTLRSMVMPRRRSGVLEYEDKVDINGVLAVLIGRSRPLIMP